MKLADALTHALRQANRGRYIVIARASEGPHAYQIRFVHSTDPRVAKREPKGILVEGRRWIDETKKYEAPARGTTRDFVGWSRWSTFLGFSIPGVLADDWVIVENDKS